jgi:GH15 family glucan-1,4-alpha-glucosidase
MSEGGVTHLKRVGWGRPVYQRDQDGYLPIEGYGVIGNGRTAALVGSDASIDWLCFPRFDSPSVFGRILDTERGGYWQICPLDESATVTRRYLRDTNVLVTRFTTKDGIAEVVDFMPSIGYGGNLGITNRIKDGMVIRIIRGVEGSVRLRQEIAPRFDYGRDEVSFELVAGRGALAKGSAAFLSINCPLAMRVEGRTLVSQFSVTNRDEYATIATYHESRAPLWMEVPPAMSQRLLGYEILGWRTWISRCLYDGPYAEQLRRSTLTLKLLDYLPSGAMVAAATTSLPEDPGGVRNWDYRYSWIRDTTYALFSFMSIGYREEAESFFQLVLDATDLRPADLQIMYKVEGEREIPEEILDHLDGYRKSRPVRIGNAAFQQRQLDVWGEILDAAHVYRRFGGVISDALWQYLVSLVNVVIERWRETDSGIWEIRSSPRRMTYSNMMCWVAMDRAVKMAKRDQRPAPIEHWERVRDEIRAEIFQFGVSSRTGAFTLSFEGDELDASALSFPLRRFVKAEHPVMRATLEAIERDLTVDGLVARYRVEESAENVDGLPGTEGHFVLTSCWLIDNYVALGEIDQARELLETLLGRANDLGLFAEQIDPETGCHVGNFPQAFSHLGIVNTILTIANATGDYSPPISRQDQPTGVIAGS